MKIKFNGVIERRKSGCGACGRAGKTTSQMLYRKMYILPSGQMKTFRAGVVEDVSDTDGEFLLSYACFERVV